MTDEALHPHGFLDDDFAKFREQRLKQKTQAMRAVDDVTETQCEPEAAEPEATEPEAGYLDDEFAKFREQRLRKTGKLPPAPEPEAAEDDGMFFGTSSGERRRIRATETARRQAARVDAATRRVLRRKESDRQAS